MSGLPTHELKWTLKVKGSVEQHACLARLNVRCSEPWLMTCKHILPHLYPQISACKTLRPVILFCPACCHLSFHAYFITLFSPDIAHCEFVAAYRPLIDFCPIFTR